MHFEVTAPGIAEPDGTVVIKVGDRERTVTVKKGKRGGPVRGLSTRAATGCAASTPAAPSIEPGKARDWVRVPGKGPFAKS